MKNSPVEPLVIHYRAQVTRARPGAWGSFFRFLGQQPIAAGCLCGLLAVLVAGIQQPKAWASAPAEVVFLAIIVTSLWIGVASWMRPIFLAQGVLTMSVVRLISYDGKLLLWVEGERILKSLSNPNISLICSPVPSELSRRTDVDWPVYFVASNDDGSFVCRSEISARDAATCAESTPEEPAIDESLPLSVASSMISFIRRIDQTNTTRGENAATLS
jgi:hypothetical protein